jgi:spore coat-associated protein N
VKPADSNDLTCSGTVTPVITQRAVIGSALDLGAVTTTLNSSVAAASLRVTVSLPPTADNTFQGLSNTVNFTFDATQRAAQTL